MELGTLTQAQYLELLIRLGGSGYSSDEDSVRVGEMNAIARMAAMVTEAMNETVANEFLSSCTSALDLRERTAYLIQLSSLPVAVRRARLLVALQGSWLVQSRLASAFSRYLGDAAGTTQRPVDTDAKAQRAAPESGLLVARREPAAITKQAVRDLSTVLQRGLPARVLSPGVSQRDAVWGDALEPAGLKVTPAVTIAAQTKARTAPLEFRPGDQLSREAWIELQSMLCWKSHGFSIDQDKQGRTVMVRNAAIGAGSGITVDGPTATTSIDWSNRIVQVWGTATAASLADLTTATEAQNVWLAPSKTGPAGAPWVHKLLGCDTDVAAADSGLTIDLDVFGNVRVNNTTGATVYATLMIRCTPTYTPGSTTDTQPWIDSAQAQSADLAELYRAQLITDGAVGKFAGVDAGALRRVVYSGPLSRNGISGASGIPQGVTLDTSEDWRNRYVLVVPSAIFTGIGGTGSTFPVPSADGMITPPMVTDGRIVVPRMFFTGPGSTFGNSTKQAYQQPCYYSIGGNTVWIFADSVTGALCMEMKSTSAAAAGSVLALITASERTTGTSVVTPVPVHATQLQTLDLEQPQNVGTYQQGRQGNVPRYLLTDPAPKTRPTCAPLGLNGDGAFPCRPVAWEIRERLGATDDGTWQRRQGIFGQRKRVVSLTIPAGTSRMVDDFNLIDQMAPGVNDQIDMRDRVLWIEGRWSTSDITVNKAAQADDSAAGQFSVAMYSGPYERVIGPISGNYILGNRVTFDGTNHVDVEFVFTRDGVQQGLHSVLRVNNASGVTVYMSLTVEVSGKLGLCDSRAYGID